MSTATQQRNARRWVLPFLAALVAVVAIVGLAGSASADERGVSQTRVGASNLAVGVLVEPPEHIAAGQRLGNDVAEPETAVATGVAAKTGPDVSQILLRSPGQLQSKFKHAGDFGVAGNYSKANAAKFSAAVNQHINAAGTRAIQGTYRGGSATHYLDPSTGLNVISRNGEFLSGWRLNPDQLANVLRTGSLGGG